MVKYVNDILTKTNELVDAIKESRNYKRYKEVKELISKDSKITTLIDEVKLLQKKIVKENAIGNDVSNINDELNKKINDLECFPLYLEYNYLQSELNIEMQVIRDSIEVALNKITN